jgi:hypothetical protein
VVSVDNPTVGGVGQGYNFDVVYSLPPTTIPAVHNVTIDGNDFPMTVVGPAGGGQKGTLYQYTTSSLGVGEHSFAFTFSDPSTPSSTTNTDTLPQNGVPFFGPEVHDFRLNFSSPPQVAMPGQAITYSATYISPSNTPPTLTDVDIDGHPYTLQSTGGTNYMKGVTYTYTTTSLGIGEHYYRYRFNDTSNISDQAIYEGSVKPWITPLILSNSTYSVSGGTTIFSTTYMDSSNAAPTATVYVDNQAYPMSCVSNPCSYSTGTVYQSQPITLPSGTHTFFFIFNDGSTSWADPFSPSVYKASLTTNMKHARFVRPTILTPTHDENPDIIQGQINSNDTGDADG